MSKQFYFENEDSEFCYTIDYFRDKSDPEEKEITIYKAIPLNDDTFFGADQLMRLARMAIVENFAVTMRPKTESLECVSLKADCTLTEKR